MEFLIRLTEKAISDLKTAKAWYEEQQPGLADKFIRIINDQLEELRNETVEYRKIYKDVRKVSTKKFPFSIYFLYEFTLHAIDIIAVLHNKKDESSVLKERTAQ